MKAGSDPTPAKTAPRRFGRNFKMARPRALLALFLVASLAAVAVANEHTHEVCNGTPGAVRARARARADGARPSPRVLLGAPGGLCLYMRASDAPCVRARARVLGLPFWRRAPRAGPGRGCAPAGAAPAWPPGRGTGAAQEPGRPRVAAEDELAAARVTDETGVVLCWHLQYDPKDGGDQVVLWMNTVGPYHNRQETYSFFTLPFCKGPEKVSHHHESLGEALAGTELEFSGLDIKFMRTYRRCRAGTARAPHRWALF